MKYVVGFLFGPDDAQVALILKQKPDWQRGLLNGVGGKIEEDETPEQAMVREFEEETGALVPADQWRKFALLNLADGGEVHCFCSNQRKVVNLKSVTNEKVQWEFVCELFDRRLPTINNVTWLVGIALDPNKVFAVIQYAPATGDQ